MRDLEHLRNMLERARKEFTKKYCLHPEAPSKCSTTIVSAHSVQRAMLKNHIAEDGHVVQIKASPQVNPVGMLVQPERIGINKATTFFGFCGTHDTVLFSPLEGTAFNFTPKQIALLGYRAVCRELYLKDAEISAAEAVRNYAALLPAIIGFDEKERRHKVTQLARINARTTLTNTKELYASMLLDERTLRYYAVQFSDAPVHFTSVSFLPEWDFDENRLQDLSFIKEYKPICFSAWAADCKAAAVFCWHESADEICVPFIDSLRKSESSRIPNRILSMAFEVSDNVVFSDNWWMSLSEPDRERIINRTLSGVGNFDRRQDCLADDGLMALTSSIQAEHVRYGANLGFTNFG